MYKKPKTLILNDYLLELTQKNVAGRQKKEKSRVESIW